MKEAIMSFDRMYYTIGQLSKISGLPQSVLRYWETVFDLLTPSKSDGGTRQYSEGDIKLVLEIKKLLYDEGYTIKGANKLIKTTFSKKGETDSNISESTPIEQLQNTSKKDKIYSEDTQTINQIKERIKSILEIIDS
jgi:DNA-binding transcriptional MerR regulator